MTSPSKVALFGSSSPIAEQVSKQSKWFIHHFDKAQCDFTNADHFDRLDLSEYDLLISLVGCNQAGGVEIVQQESKDIQTTMSTNLIGNMMLIQKYMQHREHGTLIILTSRASYKITKANLTYGISKNSLTNFLDQVRQFYQQFRIIEVSPCAIRNTPFQYKKYHPLIQRGHFTKDEVDKIISAKWQNNSAYTPFDIAEQIIKAYSNSTSKVFLSKD